MTETLELLLSHRSERDYTDEPLTARQLDAIVDAAYHAPTSINAQHVSLVVVKDAAHRARIAECAGGQPWVARAPVFIAVLIDFNKTRLGVEAAGSTQVMQESLEGFAAAAVDAGIALESMMLAARALGLGVVPIGGIRRNTPGMIEVLGLPPLTFPVVGLTVGHVRKPAAVKPRLPRESFCHDEHYDAARLPAAIAAYDRTLAEHWRSIGRPDGLTWSQNMASHYGKDSPIRPTLADAARQGLTNKK